MGNDFIYLAGLGIKIGLLKKIKCQPHLHLPTLAGISYFYWAVQVRRVCCSSLGSKKVQNRYKTSRFVGLCEWVTCDRWQVMHNMWQVICKTWHVTYDIWHLIYFILFQFNFLEFFYWRFYPHTLRDSVSPVCGIIKMILYVRNTSATQEITFTSWIQKFKMILKKND